MKIRRLLAASGVIAIASTFVGVMYIRSRSIPDDAYYLGSSRCQRCHSDVYDDWRESQHTKMMRPANEPGVVVADFSHQGDAPRFDRADAVWAIGGKWEQQFMGEEAGEDTLLPGAWLRSSTRWDLRGWDGWERPDPVRRCHGCHTVGLNVATEHFVEPSIGCESCHGPGSWHVATFGLGRIHAGADSDTCGQCHTRGESLDGSTLFPTTYRPGSVLAGHFDFSKPVPGQNSSFWYGNGRPRKRHQEFQAWTEGGHANSLRSLRVGYDGRYGAVTEHCLECHAGDYIRATGRHPGVDEAREGITCGVCHNVHGDLASVRMDCGKCHQGGAYYHTPRRNADHVACPKSAGVGCVGCHMPVTIPIGGGVALHDHAPGVVPPRDTLAWGTPSSCANGGCHAGDTPGALQAMFEAHYGGYGEPRGLDLTARLDSLRGQRGRPAASSETFKP